MEENFTCSFDVSGRGTRNSSATINVGYDFVNSSTQENIFSGNKSFPCTTDENGVLIYNGGTTIPFKIENEVIQGRYTINVDCLISAVEEIVTFTKNSITITPIEKDVWVEFNDYGELTDADLSGLVNGWCMFSYTNVGQITNEDETVQSVTFDYDLSSLTDGHHMFGYCENLTSFSADLPSLTDGEQMFYRCSNLTSFTSQLPSLTDGDSMFYGCSNLTSFTSDLSSVTSGSYMFYDCENLTTFTSKLSSLKSGYMMFDSCKLDTESLRNITNNINDLVEKGYDRDTDEHWTYEVLGETKTIARAYRERIDIDLNSSVTQEVITECGNILIEKGWTEVYFNGKKF